MIGGAGWAIGINGAAVSRDYQAVELDPFQAESVEEVLAALGVESAEPSDRILIRAPTVAEDGKAVPIGIASDIDGTTEIIVIASANPKPLAARYRFKGRATPSVEYRLKIAKTTNLIAIVTAGGRRYRAQTQVKVTRGGCGG